MHSALSLILDFYDQYKRNNLLYILFSDIHLIDQYLTKSSLEGSRSLFDILAQDGMTHCTGSSSEETAIRDLFLPLMLKYHGWFHTLNSYAFPGNVTILKTDILNVLASFYHVVHSKRRRYDFDVFVKLKSSIAMHGSIMHSGKNSRCLPIVHQFSNESAWRFAQGMHKWSSHQGVEGRLP